MKIQSPANNSIDSNSTSTSTSTCTSTITMRFENCIADDGKWNDMIQFLRSDSETTARKKELLTMISSPYSPNSYFQLIKHIAAVAVVDNKNNNNSNDNGDDNGNGNEDGNGARIQEQTRAQAAKELLFTIIDLGGKDFVMTTRGTYAGGFRKGTILHAVAYSCKDAVDIVTKLIYIGGRELVLVKNGSGGTALHEACFGANRSSVGVISALIDIDIDIDIETDTDAGCTSAVSNCTHQPRNNDILMAKDTIGQNSLHIACHCNASVDVIMKLIDAGGKELALENNYRGSNALAVCFATNRASVDVIKKLIDVGGEEILLAKNNNSFGETALHVACNNNASIEKIMCLIGKGKGEILALKDHGHKSPLHFLICDEVNGRLFYRNRRGAQTAERIAILIREGIRFCIGGEFGIGGLFNSTSERVQEEMYQKWNERILPALRLEQVNINLVRRRDSQQQPILHAALINKAPLNIIKDIIEHFMDSIHIRDSMGRYPIDVAIVLRRAWNDGMKELVEAFASAQECTIIHICAKHGLPWENGLQNMLEESDSGNSGEFVVEEQDNSTGLYPFMNAGVVPYNLESIFHLIRKNPRLVHVYTSKRRTLPVQKRATSSATNRGGEIVQGENLKRKINEI